MKIGKLNIKPITTKGLRHYLIGLIIFFSVIYTGLINLSYPLSSFIFLFFASYSLAEMASGGCRNNPLTAVVSFLFFISIGFIATAIFAVGILNLALPMYIVLAFDLWAIAFLIAHEVIQGKLRSLPLKARS